MKKTKILVVDDETSIVKYVGECLRQENYEVITAGNGIEGLSQVERESPSLVILDIKMPGMDGIEACRRLREWSQIPVIILSAIGDEESKIQCFIHGADDYITKPFGSKELMLRVKAVLRRCETAPVSQPALKVKNLTIDFAARRVILDGREVNLTATEYTLLSLLAQNAGMIITQNQILEKVWGEEYTGDYHLLHVNIERLRRKLKSDTGESSFIETRSGIGYMFIKSPGPES